MKKLKKINTGDIVAVVSPSFAAGAVFPEVFEFGLSRMRDIFGVTIIESPTTRRLNASKDDRAADLISVFQNPEIKAVFATIGGNDQVTYIKNLPLDTFAQNPKPYFGYSDNSHL
jgi:muramoyltetrapeptide carboxypeptidase LdcA involved in peptidoglycan recycling